MSPCGAVEIPLRYMVPTIGSAPRSSSKLTNSKLPAHIKTWWRLKPETARHRFHHFACIYLYFPAFGMNNPLTRVLMHSSDVDRWPAVISLTVKLDRIILLCVCTCSSSQLKWRLCVVLHPVLQGTLHVGFGIQQQLQVGAQTGMMGENKKSQVSFPAKLKVLFNYDLSWTNQQISDFQHCLNYRWIYWVKKIWLSSLASIISIVWK